MDACAQDTTWVISPTSRPGGKKDRGLRSRGHFVTLTWRGWETAGLRSEKTHHRKGYGTYFIHSCFTRRPRVQSPIRAPCESWVQGKKRRSFNSPDIPFHLLWVPFPFDECSFWWVFLLIRVPFAKEWFSEEKGNPIQTPCVSSGNVWMRLENVSKRTVTEEGVEQVNMCTPRNRVKRGVPMKETTPTIHFICYECSISFFFGSVAFLCSEWVTTSYFISICYEFHFLLMRVSFDECSFFKYECSFWWGFLF